MSGLTVKQAAQLVNVSERSVYDARRLMRSGQTELIQQVGSGQMSLHRALLIAGLKKPPRKAANLQSLWLRATATERREFLDWLSDERRNDESC